MVDRYQSLLENSGQSRKNRNSSILFEKKGKGLDELINKTQKNAEEMKRCIRQYRQATTSAQQKEIISKFKTEQQNLQKSREILTQEFKNMDGGDNPQKLLIKQHLLKTVQRQLKLDVEMNEIISSKQNQLQVLTKKLQPGSDKLKNALSDLNQKRNQIIYLQQQVKQCVQLLEIIGILVLQNTQKINYALEQVQRANEEVQKSLKSIELAKMNTQKSRKRKCCIIFIGLIVIIVIVAVVFGINFLGA